MTSITVEPEIWPRRRWLGTFALIFIVQVGLIVALSEHEGLRVRPPGPSPVLQLVAAPSTEWQDLNDPTLFALPHRQSFAGLAWLKVPQLEFSTMDFSEATNWLALNPARLGAAFNEFTETNVFNALPVPMLPKVDLLQPYFTSLSNLRNASSLRLEGELARRRLVSSLQLPSWPNSDLLTNTVVQVVVDRAGRLVSVPLLLASSSLKAADDYALDQARTLRFEASTSQQRDAPADGLSWGQIIFEWNTVPVPPANAPPGQTP